MEDEGMMPPEAVARDFPQPSTQADENDTAPGSQKKTVVRKRTKTGCFTCRKRRIKCDEGRPTCNNCLRSKRQCDGYTQRVIFKDPLGTFVGAPFGHMQYPGPSPQALVREQQISAAQQRSTSRSLQIIAPRPPSAGYHPSFPHGVPPLGYDPAMYGPQPMPSRFTFHPPETVDGFAHNQWRQGQTGEASHPLPQNVSPISPVSPVGVYEGGQVLNIDASALEAHGISHEGYEYYVDHDDDLSMAESNDETVFEDCLDNNEVGAVILPIPRRPVDLFGTRSRTFSAADDIMVAYEPSPYNSPLNDSNLAAVFWHFVNVTGPSISLYERHPHGAAPAIFRGEPVPRAQQHIWTYTCPVMAFRHPALLQAILAMATLQIAKLQGVPPTASLRHYHLALRRIARNVGQASKRAQPSNFAATLLLGYYEVWNSDHEKWSKHLLGASWIMKDIPLADMTRAMMAAKTLQRQADEEYRQYAQHPYHQSPRREGPFEEPLQVLHPDWDQIDVPLLRALSGRDVSYDDLGMIPEELSSYPRPTKHYTNKDFEMYETLSDLFWWYIKMDVYQSILAGTKLFLEYDSWMQCPPRAPIGRIDAIYGTFDHLSIVLGRLSNFSYNDMARKRRVQRAAGGGPGPKGPPPPGMGPGLMPTTGKVPTPAGFSPPRADDSSPGGSSPPNPHQNHPQPQQHGKTSSQKQRKKRSDDPPADLEAQTAAAHREWEGIREAFETFRAHVGTPFGPLDDDVEDPSNLFGGGNPFPFGGGPVRYRTFSVAGIWMNYYMGLILLYRAHPAMLPIAMVAAAMQAPVTQGFACEIARIAAGLYEEDLSSPSVVSTLVGAGLIECCFPLFVAGVQFQVNAQRHWLVRRLHAIARLTGWQSARQIADGCETAWTKAASLGRGPPYERPDDLNVVTVVVQSPPSFGGDFSASPTRLAGPPTTTTKTRVDLGNPRAIDRRIQEVDAAAAAAEQQQHLHGYDAHPSDANASSAAAGKIIMAEGEKAHYAMGLLAVENVLEKLDLGADDDDDDDEDEVDAGIRRQ